MRGSSCIKAFRIRCSKSFSRARKIVADGGQDDICRIAVAALEMAAAEVSVGLHMTDHGLDGGAAPEFAFDHPEDATLLARDEDAARVTVSRPR